MDRERCNVAWRSHACELPAGHDGPHTCVASCDYDQPYPGDKLYDVYTLKVIGVHR